MGNRRRVLRGEIYLVNLDNRFGSEQRGTRPCIVVSNAVCNYYSPVITVVPLTTKIFKNPLPTHILFNAGDYNLPTTSIALAEQVTTIDKGRIVRKFSTCLSPEDLARLDAALQSQLALRA